MLLQTANFCSFCGWVIVPCIYAPRLYPFICWWTFRLFPCHGYWKQCLLWTLGCLYFLELVFFFFFFFWIYIQEQNCWSYRSSETVYHRLGLEPICPGTWWTQPKSSLRLEPMWLALKPSQNPVWDLNQTWLWLKPNQNPWYLVLGHNKAQVLDVSSQKEFSERQSDR